MLELAARYGSGEPVRIRDIADEHDIPSRFLVQILLQLKGAGFVASTRGAAGGYQLLVPPDEISLRDVMVVIEGSPEAALTSSAAPTSSAAKTLLHVWREVTSVEQQMLGEITFAELVTRAKRETDMYYI